MNRITLMGRITVTPELKEGNGIKYCNFSIAVDRIKKTGAEAVTDFFNCTAFGQNAEFVSGYMVKGQRILVSGAVHIDSYVSKSGEKKMSINVITDTVENADVRKKNSNEGKNEGTDGNEPAILPFS